MARRADGLIPGLVAVIVQERENTLKVAVARPLRDSATVRVAVTPSQTGYQLVRKDSAVAVVSTGGSVVLDVKTAPHGRTMYAEFSRSG